LLETLGAACDEARLRYSFHQFPVELEHRAYDLFNDGNLLGVGSPPTLAMRNIKIVAASRGSSIVRSGAVCSRSRAAARRAPSLRRERTACT
jgi:hypothetical protein